MVAVGSNYALFFDQIRSQQERSRRPTAIDNDTLASLLLANLTTVLSFGLIALSSIPALSAIGQVVAPGILLACCCRPRSPRAAVKPGGRAGAVCRNPCRCRARRRACTPSSPSPTLLPARCAGRAGAGEGQRRPATWARGAAVLAEPALWPWALGAVALNHALLTGAGLWPRSHLLGRNMRRLPRGRGARARSRSPSTTAPTPRSRRPCSTCSTPHGARATFFCIAARARAAPGAVPRDRRARPQRAEPQPSPPPHTSRCSARAARARDRRGAGRAGRHHRPARRASFARRPGCATRSSTRCCTGSACSW